MEVYGIRMLFAALVGFGRNCVTFGVCRLELGFEFT